MAEEALTVVEVQVDRGEEEVEVAVEHHQGQEEAVTVEGEVDTEEGVDMEEEADMEEEVEVVEAASQVEIEEVDTEAEAEGSVEETEIEPQVGVEEVEVLAEVLEEMGREMAFTADHLQEEAQRHPLIPAMVMSHQEGGAHRGGRLMMITMTTRRTK